MQLNKVRIKENITPEDIASAIELIADSCFVNGNYNPYYKGFAEKIAVVRYFLDGITFEDGDSIYVISELAEVKDLISKFLVDPKYSKTQPSAIMATVRENVAEVIEYKKQRLIHGADAIEYIAHVIGKRDNFVADLDVALGNLSKIDLKNMTKEDIDLARSVATKLNDSDVELTTENIAKIIKEASNFDVDKASQDIIDAKNAEIESLRKRIFVLENGA